ncbi:hypothetical protein ACIQUM_07285 [Amycolatopsis azurea]|uniref:hypothetical protein n=1 Tax=Amycolatopsis azurea TaxID=36819 RepID=UPI00382B0035
MSEENDQDPGAEVVRRLRAACEDAVGAIHRERDPLTAARLSHQLHEAYLEFSGPFATLRRRKVSAARAAEVSLEEMAAALNISKGRISQLAPSPPKHRAFFGNGPVHIGYPVRQGSADRERPVVAREDSSTVDVLSALMAKLDLDAERFQIDPGRADLPGGDVVLVCGPKSAPVARKLLARDPAMGMLEDGGRWWIETSGSSTRYGSPSDDPDPRGSDIAYLARHVVDGRVIIHIAGIHSIGSLGAAHHLTDTLSALHKKAAKTQFSAIVRCTYDGIRVTGTDMLAGPFLW